jgi:CubicO group peptidase (beta-lactamase class C family)
LHVTLVALLLLSLNLVGVWTSQQSYPVGQGTARDGLWIQDATGTLGYRWVTPDAQNPTPIQDLVRLNLYITQQPDGTLSAFIRNPEQNLGASIGARTVAVNDTSVTLQAQGAQAIAGQYDPVADTLTFQFQDPPGAFVFHRTSGDVIPYAYQVPRQTDDGWQVGSLESVGIDTAKLITVIESVTAQAPTSLRSPYIQSVLIARHGKLVLDAYFNGFERDDPHDVRSAGKSVTTLLVGRAMEENGATFTPQSRVYDLLKSYAPFANMDRAKKAITVADLMSMQSGYACDDNDENSPGNEDVMQSQTKQPDWYRYTLDLPMEAAPGTMAAYCTAGINLLGAIVAQETHQWLPAYFASRFAQPMQFGRYAMWLMPPPSDEAYMGGGDRFRPRDFLKFGQLFLNGGEWNGTPIIDGAWLQEVARKHSTIKGEIGDYGWGWHLYEYQLAGKSIKAISAGGNGGQLLFIFPQLDMTLMITAANYGQYPVWSNYIKTLVPEILGTVNSGSTSP